MNNLQSITPISQINLWLGRHQLTGTGLWVYNRALLPWVLEFLSEHAESIVVTGAGPKPLRSEVEAICERFPSVQIEWLPEYRGMRYFGSIMDLFMRLRKAPLFHGFSNGIPVSAFWKKQSSYVVTLHDLLQPFPPEQPKTIFHKLKHEFYRWYYARMIRNCQWIFTGHEKTEREIKERYGEETPVRVIYPPLGEDYFTTSADEKAPELPKDNFLLTFVSRDPRKNFYRTYEAFVASNADASISLVAVVGDEDVADDLRAFLAKEPHGDRVYMIVKPGKERLIQLYRAAKGTLFVSLGEGFGYPIYESLSQGTPVLTSYSLLAAPFSVSAQMVVECDPRSTTSITEGIEKLLTITPQSETLSEVRTELEANLHPRVGAQQIVQDYFEVAKKALQ